MRTRPIVPRRTTAIVALCLGAGSFFFGRSHALSREPYAAATVLLPVSAGTPTNIEITSQALHAGVKRFGINLSGQTFYDSGQMLNNLAFRNPGFEGETWQSILHCKSVTATTCSDENQYAVWPADFLRGASFEVISGAGLGSQGLVQASTTAGNGSGVRLTFAQPVQRMRPGDFVLVRLEKPGDASAGWWTAAKGGAAISTELHDLPADTMGRQALRIEAGRVGQYASVSSYFDTTEGHSFLQLRGRFTLSFRAKGLGSNQKVQVQVERQNSPAFFSREVMLSPSWQNYRFDFSAHEDGSSRGTVGLSFRIQQSSMLLDEVELTADGNLHDNPTRFRDEVVTTLRELRPGVIRFMDNGASFGSTLDDLIAPPLARRRAGVFLATARVEDIPTGLEESLELAEAVHAEPWYTLPATTSPEEAKKLIEFLAGPEATRYGARRAALGHADSWTKSFHTIHLELGNEMWNAGTFAGAALSDPAAYAARAAAVFGAARASSWFQPESFDLVIGSQAENPWWTQQELRTDARQDTLAVAPYLFGQFNDASSLEAIFGSMFAEPEWLDLHGAMAEQAAAVRQASKPIKTAVYEVNLGTVSSKSNAVTQTDISRTVPSLGAGLAVADHMLLMLRELGIVTQCLFALPEYSNPFLSPDGAKKTTPLWGSVVDMGGATNLRRPGFLALQLMNQAIRSNELVTRLTGANPTWDQPASANDAIPASKPHLLQAFAFGEGNDRSLILLNLSRTTALPVTLSGSESPGTQVSESRLTAPAITDNNEAGSHVAISRQRLSHFAAGKPYLLPPFSLTVLEWNVHPEVQR